MFTKSLCLVVGLGGSVVGFCAFRPEGRRFKSHSSHHIRNLGIGQVLHFVIVISKFLRRYSKAKCTRAPAYSRALRRIKGGFPKGGSREAQVRFPEYHFQLPVAHVNSDAVSML